MKVRVPGQVYYTGYINIVFLSHVTCSTIHVNPTRPRSSFYGNLHPKSDHKPSTDNTPPLTMDENASSEPPLESITGADSITDGFHETPPPPPHLPQGFQIQFEKMLPSPARPGLAVRSPKHDLLCFVTTADNVLLYRMNGQRVWGIAPRRERAGVTRVGTVRWRPDGAFVCLLGLRGCDCGLLRKRKS